MLKLLSFIDLMKVNALCHLESLNMKSSFFVVQPRGDSVSADACWESVGVFLQFAALSAQMTDKSRTLGSHSSDGRQLGH